MNILIKSGVIITPFRRFMGDILIGGDKIVGVYENGVDNIFDVDLEIDAQGLFVSPGFIDIHTHGAGGYDISDGTGDAFLEMALWKKKMGVTTFLPTTIALPFEKIKEIIEIYKGVKEDNLYKKKRLPYMPGLHLEGPFFSKEQKGAQPEEYIYAPTKSMAEYLIDNVEYISEISMAPEVEGVLELGYELSKRGVLVSVGHSNATYADVVRAVEAGFRLVTHIYSGCSMVRRINLFRVAGVVEGGFLFDDLSVEVIGDGKHLPPSLLKLIFKNKGVSRVVGITDSISATGLPEGSYKLGNSDIIIEDGVAKLADRSSFAGSIAWTNQIVRNFRDLVGLPIEDAVRPLTVNPARLIGLYPERGVITKGVIADITVFNEKLDVFYTIREGEIIYKKKEEDKNED